MVLELLAQSTFERQSLSHHSNKSLKREIIEIHPPHALDLSQDLEYASQAAIWGIEVSQCTISCRCQWMYLWHWSNHCLTLLKGLPNLGEIYPLGGSADRLGLVDPDSGECLPAAMLPYCGRSLLEGLIRDLQVTEISLSSDCFCIHSVLNQIKTNTMISFNYMQG